MISTEHSSNNNKFQIELPKNPRSMVIFLIKARKIHRDLSSQADTKGKIELEVIHISKEWNVLHLLETQLKTHS